MVRLNLKVAPLLIQFSVAIAFHLMVSFLPLYINQELHHTLIEATHWTGIIQLVGTGLLATCAPFTGMLCDRFGTKKIMTLITFGNVIVYAGMAASTNVLHLVVFRGLQGAFGGFSTVMFALVASTVQTQELRKALSYQLAALILGSVISPGIGGFFASIIGYRLTFLTSSLMFAALTPVIFWLKIPSPVNNENRKSRLKISDVKTTMPDFFALVLVNICISFISPTTPWLLKSLGVPQEQLLTSAALVATISGLAFAAATPLMTKKITDRTMPILSIMAAGAIFMTAFVNDAYQFVTLLAAIGVIQAGIPPNLLGGKNSGRGAIIGLLNSARFTGMALGPFIATSILGDGEPPKVLYMFMAMSFVSIMAALLTYLTHTRAKVKS